MFGLFKKNKKMKADKHSARNKFHSIPEEHYTRLHYLSMKLEPKYPGLEVSLSDIDKEKYLNEWSDIEKTMQIVIHPLDFWYFSAYRDAATL